MTGWKTLHKRAARRERISQARIDEALALMLPHVLDSLVVAALRAAPSMVALELGIQLTGEALSAWNAAVDTACAELRRRRQWPEIVLEDILDADLIG